jgi:CRP-like cAMP-binding protein
MEMIESQAGENPAPLSVSLAIQLLTSPSAFGSLSLGEAAKIVEFMKPARYDGGTCFIQEGDAADTGFMALLIEGEVIVENIVVDSFSPITTAVLGPGSLVGEMGLLDNGPRSASCTAATELYCAILTRNDFYTLIVKEPVIGAKLMLGVSIRITERLRETARKLKLYAKMCQSMRAEMDRVIR